jgi:hypothetical protein
MRPQPPTWDAAAEETRWHNSLAKSVQALGEFGEQLSRSSPDFYHLCLAEVDAVRWFIRPESFSSREAFVTTLKNLISHPTTPSCPILSVAAYEESQRSWLTSLVQQYETKNPEGSVLTIDTEAEPRQLAGGGVSPWVSPGEC